MRLSVSQGKSDLNLTNMEGTEKWGVEASFTYNATEKQHSLQAAATPSRHETPSYRLSAAYEQLLRWFVQ